MSKPLSADEVQALELLQLVAEERERLREQAQALAQAPDEAETQAWDREQRQLASTLAGEARQLQQQLVSAGPGHLARVLRESQARERSWWGRVKILLGWG